MLVEDKEDLESGNVNVSHILWCKILERISFLCEYNMCMKKVAYISLT